MILYLDASVLVKRFVAEPGTEAVNEIVSCAEVMGTALICRAEVAAALRQSDTHGDVDTYRAPRLRSRNSETNGLI